MDDRPRRKRVSDREGPAERDRPPAPRPRRRLAIEGFTATPWAAAFTAIAGSSAALTGLLFVAISINLSQILKGPGLILRAVEVLILLTAVLALSTLLLMPAQSAATLGSEVLTVGVLGEALVTWIEVRALRQLSVSRFQFVMRVFGSQLPLVLMDVGGVSLLAQTAGGLYWVVPGMVAAMVAAIIGAWVLLVEILR